MRPAGATPQLGPTRSGHVYHPGAQRLPPDSAYRKSANVNVSSLVDIRHDPDLLEQYYRALDQLLECPTALDFRHDR
jgi:hypothetical protein